MDPLSSSEANAAVAKSYLEPDNDPVMAMNEMLNECLRAKNTYKKIIGQLRELNEQERTARQNYLEAEKKWMAVMSLLVE